MRPALVALCLLRSATGFSQAIPKFHLGLGLDLAIPIAGEPGLLLAIEPKYGISQAVDVGLRYEAATMRRTTDRPTVQYYGPSQTTQSLLPPGCVHTLAVLLFGQRAADKPLPGSKARVRYRWAAAVSRKKRSQASGFCEYASDGN